MSRVAIDPVTRIEGHLRLEAEHSGGVVRDAWSTGTMFRGLELILAGRDPRDAWMFAQRACGVCTHVHALASVRAVEAALGVTVPPNARLVRNLLSASQLVHDHVVHFFHLHALDWVDVLSALKADPATTARLCQRTNVGWPNNSSAHFSGVLSRLSSFVRSRQLGPFSHGYWGHPAYRLTPEANLLLFAHYLEALEWQREIVRIHAILGGKNPHPQTYLVGGMSIGFAPDAPSGVNTRTLGDLTSLVRQAREFVDKVLVPDVSLLAATYADPWVRLGRGVGRFLSYGDLPAAGGTGANFFPAGRVVGTDLSRLLPVDQALVAETVAHSWYRYAGGNAALKHPYQGETNPDYTGPKPPYEWVTTDAYSWLKAPRYDGDPYEVGPLARLAVAYAAGRDDVRASVNDLLARLRLRREALFSTLGRVVARALETQWVAARLPAWVEELRANMARGDLRVADTARWDPSTWPKRAEGWGAVEAPRGALGHWIRIEAAKVAAYQLVVPSTWNGSPRDAAGARGPWEQALVGLPLADPARPLEVLRTVHSFDPCMACAVHVHDPGGGASTVVRVD